MWRIFVESKFFFFSREVGGFVDCFLWSIKTDLSDTSDSPDLILRQKRLIRQNRLLDKRLFRLHNPHNLSHTFPLTYPHKNDAPAIQASTPNIALNHFSGETMMFFLIPLIASNKRSNASSVSQSSRSVCRTE